MAHELRQHQKDALDFLKDKAGAAIFYEPGLGKTRIMLEHLSTNPHKFFPCLVVGPLSAVSVWGRESQKFEYPFTFKELTGSFYDRLEALNSDAQVYVINYEGLRVIGPQLFQKQFKTIIVDESHRAKNRTAIQTTKLIALSCGIPNRYILTGTPVANSPEDIWTQFQIIAPEALGNFYAFRNRYVEYKSQMIRIKGSMKEIRKPIRFKNSKELGERLKPFALRRTKKECLDLPEKIYKTITCEMSKEQEKHYFSLKNSLATLLKEKQFRIASAAALLQKLQQVCQGFLYDENKNTTLFPSGKIDILKDLLQDIAHEKIILFTWFQADEDRLFDELSKDYNVLRYRGTPEDRASVERSFQEDERPSIFLAQIERAKESITLTAASHVIYFGNSWNYVSRVQSEDRAHRDGQKRNVIYYDLIIPKTIEEKILFVLRQKGKLADTITQDTARLAMMEIDEQYAI